MTETIVQDIKINCDVSDARFWGHFSICGLLMRYRDLYRSEQGLEPWASLPRQDITSWIERKEAQWPYLESQEFGRIRTEGGPLDPFDSTGINSSVNPKGLVYGAGYGMYLKPTFFLARLRSVSDVEGHRVYVSDRELVRDLFTAPAMLQEHTIFLRLDPLQALLWDAFSRIRPGCPSVLTDAFRKAGITPGQTLDKEFAATMDRMAVSYAEVLLWHELSESRERAPGWKDLLAEAGDRKSELFLRAVQDLVADTSDAGPIRRIIDRRDEGALAAIVGLLEGFRKALFPECREAYRRFVQERTWSVIEEVRVKAHVRFREMRRSVLEAFTQGGRESLQQVLQKQMQGMV